MTDLLNIGFGVTAKEIARRSGLTIGTVEDELEKLVALGKVSKYEADGLIMFKNSTFKKSDTPVNKMTAKVRLKSREVHTISFVASSLPELEEKVRAKYGAEMVRSIKQIHGK